MGLKSIIIVVLALNYSTNDVVAQQNDSLRIFVEGKVVDASSQQSIPAQIKYESLPYGSKIGVFSGNSFTFNMEEGNDYSIMVEADGYASHIEILKADDAVDGRLTKRIELRKTGVDRLMRLEQLIFAQGRADISPESYQELNELVAMLSSNQDMSIQLEGHTDYRGNARQNMKLSEKRVNAVKNYIVRQGIDKRRIKTKAFGGTQPISREDDTESRRKNRRVEVRILSN